MMLFDMKSNFVNDALWKHIDAFVTAFTLVLVFLDLYSSKKQLDTIRIYLEFDDGGKEEIYPMKRKNFSRAELKGILRELHKSKDNYVLSYMSEREFLEDIFLVQEGEMDIFIMKVRDKDFFKYKRMK